MIVKSVNGRNVTLDDGKTYTVPGGAPVPKVGQSWSPITAGAIENTSAAQAPISAGAIPQASGSSNTQNNIKSGLASFGGGVASGLGGLGGIVGGLAGDAAVMGVRDPTSPGKEGLAELVDESATAIKERGQQEFGRGSRSEIAKGTERAKAEGAVENAQNVSQLGGNVGSAAALQRTPKAADFAGVAKEQSDLRKIAEEQLREGDDRYQAAQKIRTSIAGADAEARGVARAGMRAGGIAGGAPVQPVTDEQLPPGIIGERPPAIAPEEGPEPIKPGEEPPPIEQPDTPESIKKTSVERVDLALEDVKPETPGYEDLYKQGIEAATAALKDNNVEPWKAFKKAGEGPPFNAKTISEDPRKRHGAKVAESALESVDTVVEPQGSPSVSGDSRSGGGGGNASGSAYGGYTGEGEMFEPAGVVHKGEFVIPKKHVNQETHLPEEDYVKTLASVVSDYRLKKRFRNITGAIHRRF
jgi:hypothetical protein